MRPTDDAVDCDPAETRDRLESLEAVTRSVGNERGKYLLQQLDVDGAPAARFLSHVVQLLEDFRRVLL